MNDLEKHPSSIVRIRFQDCDPFGHLNNGRYLDYVINAREEQLLDHYDLDIYAERFRDLNWVVRTSRVAYQVPILPNRQVRIQTALLHHTRSALQVEAVLTDPETNVFHAAAWVNLVHVNLRTGRPAKHDEDLMELFEAVSLGIEPESDAERLKAIKKERERVVAAV